ncbi:hypothetical protein MJN54_36420, partial [Salmonella enterica subsp. enterica serovar Kentucky]|nr:hypothetical protein [Salmonella enterica subsp. enterica serovar Kentucky]
MKIGTTDNHVERDLRTHPCYAGKQRNALIQKTQPMAGFLLFWEWKSVAPISGLTSYNEKARFSLAQRPA